MLEKMVAFFDARLDGYEEHMLGAIEGAEAFYPFTASLLPEKADTALLDLGCGTGLELGYYFQRCPSARVTGIDLAPGMLGALRQKFPDKALDLRLGSYFELPLGESVFDAAVSVESLHHFTAEEKLPLYRRLRAALKPDGYFVLTDYFAPDEETERRLRAEYLHERAEQGITDGAFYHFDTPLTVEHECQVLREAGFSDVKVVRAWENTKIVVAKRE